MTIRSNQVDALILRCDVCEEEKHLVVGETEGGHSWAAAQFIADEFDKFHDEECE